jgi:hypothetical protein
MSEDEAFFFGVVRAVVILGGLILAFSYGACEIAHRWEARAPERDHPEPCQDSAIEVDDTYKRQCLPGAIGTIEKVDGKAVWVCRCARDGGAP